MNDCVTKNFSFIVDQYFWIIIKSTTYNENMFTN